MELFETVDPDSKNPMLWDLMCRPIYFSIFNLLAGRGKSTTGTLPVRFLR
jgi:hypothetical protein